jgi:hypothetical protein
MQRPRGKTAHEVEHQLETHTVSKQSDANTKKSRQKINWQYTSLFGARTYRFELSTSLHFVAKVGSDRLEFGSTCRLVVSRDCPQPVNWCWRCARGISLPTTITVSSLWQSGKNRGGGSANNPCCEGGRSPKLRLQALANTNRGNAIHSKLNYKRSTATQKRFEVMKDDDLAKTHRSGLQLALLERRLSGHVIRMRVEPSSPAVVVSSSNSTKEVLAQ